MIPTIHTFKSETAPQGQSAVAFFYEIGAKSVERLPMVFAAATEQDARELAEHWWTEERKKEERRRAAIAAAQSARAKSKATP